MNISRQLSTVLTVSAAAVLLVGAGVGFTVYTHSTHEQPTEPKVASFVIPADMPVTRAEAPENPETYAEVQMAIQQEEADAAAAAAAQAAADAAAAQAAADAAAQHAAATRGGGSSAGSGSATGGHAAGTPLPFTADANDANGGEYADPGTFCAAHSASVVGGVEVCD